MNKYIVLGHTEVTVSCEVEADTPEEAIKIASKKFGGVHSFSGNGGTDKLIGVNGPNETIAADEEIIFDDCIDT